MALNTRTRRICFTANRPYDKFGWDQNDPVDLLSRCITVEEGGLKFPIKFLIYQYESGDSGTPHWQGYIEFDSAQYLLRLRTWDFFEITGAHLEVARGTQAQNISYCSKAPRLAGPWRIGEARAQGKRSDLLGLKDQIDAGDSVLDLFDGDHFGSMVRYNRGILLYKRIKTPERATAPLIIVYYGETGVGKSHRAAHYASECSRYWQSEGRWWPDYDLEEICIIDEMYGARFSYTFLLRLLDRYPLKVEYKGGHAEFSSPVIIFTSNYHPSEWYRDHEQAKFGGWMNSPLRRRLSGEGNRVVLCGGHMAAEETDQLDPPEQGVPLVRTIAEDPPRTAYSVTTEPAPSESFTPTRYDRMMAELDVELREIDARERLRLALRSPCDNSFGMFDSDLFSFGADFTSMPPLPEADNSDVYSDWLRSAGGED